MGSPVSVGKLTAAEPSADGRPGIDITRRPLRRRTIAPSGRTASGRRRLHGAETAELDVASNALLLKRTSHSMIATHGLGDSRRMVRVPTTCRRGITRGLYRRETARRLHAISEGMDGLQPGLGGSLSAGVVPTPAAPVRQSRQRGLRRVSDAPSGRDDDDARGARRRVRDTQAGSAAASETRRSPR